MKIPPDFAPSKVCARSKDELARAGFGADPFLQRDDDGTPWLISTNGYAAMALRVEEADQDTDGAVPVDAVVAAEKHQDDDWNPTITCGEKDAVAQLTAEAPHLTLIAPRPEVLFPPILESIAKAAAKPTDGLSVSFNVRLLARLGKGLGVEQVTLRRVSHGATYWLVVLPAADLGTPAVGILQPLAETDQRDVEIPVMKGSRGKASAPAVPTSPDASLTCSACGKPASSTVSLQTPGQDATPPVCLDCMRRATDEVKATKGKTKRGGES